MKVPIPIYIAHPTRDTPGNNVRFTAGQRARFLGENGEREVVVISGEPVGHDAAPGVACLEVMFDDGAGCVDARKLRLP
jgi:hypothetical protein